MPVCGAALQAGAALDGTVDVVVGYRTLLRLLDGVVEGRVAGRVTATGARGDLDVLDQLGEHLAALGVDDRLLVLGGRPFGVARHHASVVFVPPARMRRARRPARSTGPAGAPPRRAPFPRSSGEHEGPR